LSFLDLWQKGISREGEWPCHAGVFGGYGPFTILVNGKLRMSFIRASDFDDIVCFLNFAVAKFVAGDSASSYAKLDWEDE
jgi:hypothetical protein